MESGSLVPKRLGVFGGTFDPPHRGHLGAASAAADAFDLDRVLFVVAGAPWQKNDYSDPEDRFLMTVLATSEDDRFEVSRAELDRPGPTYTVETIETLTAFYEGVPELFLILGADAAANLPTWAGLDRLKDLVRVIAVTRPGANLDEVTAGDALPPIDRLDIDEIDVSATEIRARCRAGGRPGDDVSPAVAAHIERARLYREARDA